MQTEKKQTIPAVFNQPAYLSNCCGAPARDPLAVDIGICPECKEHCEFETEEEEEEVITLDSDPYHRDDKDVTFTLPNGKLCRIAPPDQSFFYKLKALPVETKINIMGISLEDIEKELRKRKTAQKRALIKLLEKQWYWRETGDLAELDDVELDGTSFKASEILARCKSSRAPKHKDVMAWVEYLKSGKEVYERTEEE